jgi:hypothetical protein
MRRVIEHAYDIGAPLDLTIEPAALEAGQMAASDYVPISFKNRLY